MLHDHTFNHIAVSLLIAVGVGLGMVFLGGLLLLPEVSNSLPVVAFVGAFIKTFATLIGLICGGLYYFRYRDLT